MEGSTRFLEGRTPFGKRAAEGLPTTANAHGASRAGPVRAFIPAFQTSLMMPPPRPSKGRSREALRRRDGVRRLRALSQQGTRAAAELPPGPLGVPARSWLKARSARGCATDGLKQGPLPETSAIGAPRGARVPQGTSHKDFALFGAPSPLIRRRAEGPVSKDRGKFRQTPDGERARQRARTPCSSAAKESIMPAKAAGAACSVPVGPGFRLSPG